jgi:hypothetical protein
MRSGPELHYHRPEPEIENTTRMPSGENASIRIRTRNSSRPSPSWRTLIRACFPFLLPQTSAKSGPHGCHRHGARRSRARAGVVVRVRGGKCQRRTTTRYGLRPRPRAGLLRPSSGRGGPKRLNVRVGKRGEGRMVGRKGRRYRWGEGLCFQYSEPFRGQSAFSPLKWCFFLLLESYCACRTIYRYT